MALPSIADALVIVVLLVPGFVAFFLIRRIITGVILKRFFRKGMTAGTAWDHSFGGVSKDEQEGGYFMVYTNDGLEYKGELHMAGAEHERRDVVMRNPKLILRDKGWNVKDEIEVGKEILFVEGDIRRIVFFDEL